MTFQMQGWDAVVVRTGSGDRTESLLLATAGSMAKTPRNLRMCTTTTTTTEPARQPERDFLFAGTLRPAKRLP